MSKSLILLTAAAWIGVSHAEFICVSYGGNPSAPITEDVTIGKIADLVPCDTAKDTVYPAKPCLLTCTADTKFCFNAYKKGVDVQGGCAAVTPKCETGTTADGKDQLCCDSSKCNNDMKATQKSASTTLSVATLAAAAVGIVAALLM